MRDAAGRDIAPYDLWQATMMANSARDPLWRAFVSAEIAVHPRKRSEIEAKCLRCHAPLASAERERLDGDALTLDVLDDAGAIGQLARDGVSCTLCHQIRDEKLGDPASWSGGFKAGGEQVIYGPHRGPRTRPMQRHTGYTPRHATHIEQSSLCATCHTLFTHALNDDGSRTGDVLPEQTTYLEWRNSDYNDESAEPGPSARSCQDCHMPTTDVEGRTIRTGIARNPGGRDFPWVSPREPYGRHLVVGGNTLVPAILRDGPWRAAPKRAFDAVIAAARHMLTEQTARVEIVDVTRAGERTLVVARVTNLTGHKFPTGIPLRRAWLRLRVRDESSRVLLAWGAHDEAGRIVDQTGNVLPSEKAGGPVPPHRHRTSSAEQVPIYEAIMNDASGAPTFSLLRGARFGKDNRLLPNGWSPTHPDAKATAPAGVNGDADFQGGSDRVVFELPAVPNARSIEVDLLYQTLGARVAAELFRHKTPEIEAFRRAYEAADRTPVVVAGAKRRLE